MDTITSRYENHAEAAGVTEAVIRQVIAAFYERVKRDAILGPVFENIVGDHWDAHVEKVCSFWLYATRLSREYNGRDFMPAHIKHPSIQPALLSQWLHLFRETTDEMCTKEAASALVDIARRMAVSIEMSLARRDRTPGSR